LVSGRSSCALLSESNASIAMRRFRHTLGSRFAGELLDVGAMVSP
jgi:hypothetical protein